MLHRPIDIPGGLSENWAGLSQGQKDEMTAFYANYGWRFRAEMIAGALDVTWEQTNEAGRMAAAEANRATFLTLLSAGQRQAWDRIQSNPSLYAVNGKMTEEQERIGAERRRVFTEFRVTFTPEQQAAFERMNSLPVREARAGNGNPDFVLPHLLPVTPADPAVPARYTKAWINSHANPMLEQPA